MFRGRIIPDAPPSCAKLAAHSCTAIRMATAPKVEFFYDCSSPWTYFAFTRFQPLAAELNLAVLWRPILVGGVFNAVNQEVYASREALFKGENQRRLDYYMKDLQDWASLCGLPMQWPAGHPISSVKAMRGAYFALEQGCIVEYSEAVFRTYWCSDTPNIADEQVLRAICAEVGLDDNALLAATELPEYKDKLRTATDEVIQRGGFGSPTIFIDGTDMYFGNDRLPLVEHRLRELVGG